MKSESLLKFLVNLEIENATYTVDGLGLGLPGSYRVNSIHMHWGANHLMGSEHAIDGKLYPMEVVTDHFSLIMR